MLDKDIDYDTIILDGLSRLWLREQEYWCPDAELLDSEDIENYRGFGIMKLVSKGKREDALIIFLIGSAFDNYNAAFKIYDDGWTWERFLKSPKEDFLKYLENINFKGMRRIRMPKPNLAELLYSYIDFVGTSQINYFNNILKQEKNYFKAYDRIFDELSNNVKFLKGKFILPIFLDKMWQFYLFPIIPTEKVAAASKLPDIGIKLALGVDVGNNEQLAYNLIKEVAEKGRCLPIIARWGLKYYGDKFRTDKELTFEDIEKRAPKKLLKGEEPLNYFEEQVIRGFKAPITEHSLYWNLHVGKYAFTNDQTLNNSLKELYTLIMRLVCEQDRENATFLILLHIVSNFDPILPKKMLDDGWNWNKFFASKDDEFKRYLSDNGRSEISDKILNYKKCVGSSQERYFVNIISEEENYFKAYDRIFKEFGRFLETDFLVPAFLDALGQFKVYPILPTEKVPINKIALNNITLQFPDEQIQNSDDVRIQILDNLDSAYPEYLLNYLLNEGKIEIEEGPPIEIDESVLESENADIAEEDRRFLLPIEISRGICFGEQKYFKSNKPDKQSKDSTYTAKQELLEIEHAPLSKATKMMKVDPYEKHVEDVLADKPFLLEDGMEFIDRQYSTSNGIIDLILRDKESKLILVEIKRGMANDETLTQLLSYMDVIDNYFDAKEVRGMIVCEQYGPRLKNAVNLLVKKGHDIKLVEYKSEIGFKAS